MGGGGAFPPSTSRGGCNSGTKITSLQFRITALKQGKSYSIHFPQLFYSVQRNKHMDQCE